MMSTSDAIKIVKDLYNDLQFNDNMLYGQAITTLCKNATSLNNIIEELQKVINEYGPTINNSTGEEKSKSTGFIEGLNAAMTIINLCINKENNNNE